MRHCCLMNFISPNLDLIFFLGIAYFLVAVTTKNYAVAQNWRQFMKTKIVTLYDKFCSMVSTYQKYTYNVMNVLHTTAL